MIEKGGREKEATKERETEKREKSISITKSNFSPSLLKKQMMISSMRQSRETIHASQFYVVDSTTPTSVSDPREKTESGSV